MFIFGKYCVLLLVFVFLNESVRLKNLAELFFDPYKLLTIKVLTHALPCNSAPRRNT